MNYNIDFIINLEKNLEDNYYKNFLVSTVFNKFLSEYNNIKNTSNIPIFNNSNKFNNKKKMYKNKNNTQCIFIRNSNAWVPNSSTEFDKKIKNSIISNLNKLSSKNFDKISDILIKDLQKANDENITSIFCSELLNKNIYDKDYQDEYVKLCIKICNSDISSKENIFKCKRKLYIKKLDKYIGPFYSNSDIEEYNKNNFFFKRILLNNLCNKFINRFTFYDEIISSTDEEIKFKKKREIHSIVEFICKLFNKDVIDHHIIYLIHLSLLNTSCKLDYININVEILYNMWNILKDNNIKKFNLTHVSNIYTIIFNKLRLTNTSYRIKFFIEEVIGILKNTFRSSLKQVNINDLKIIFNDNTMNENNYSESKMNDNTMNDNTMNDNTMNDNTMNENNYSESDIEDDITNALLDDTIYDVLLSSDCIEEYLDTMIYIVLNNILLKDNCIKCLQNLLKNNIIDNNLIEKLISHSEEEIEEMMLDNNKVKENFVILQSELNKHIIA